MDLSCSILQYLFYDYVPKLTSYPLCKVYLSTLSSGIVLDLYQFYVRDFKVFGFRDYEEALGQAIVL